MAQLALPSAEQGVLNAPGVVIFTLNQAKLMARLREVRDICSAACDLVEMLQSKSNTIASKGVIQLCCAAAVLIAKECREVPRLEYNEHEYMRRLDRSMKALKNHYDCDLSTFGDAAARSAVEGLHKALEQLLVNVEAKYQAFFAQLVDRWNREDAYGLHLMLQRNLDGTGESGNPHGSPSTVEEDLENTATGSNNVNSFNSTTIVECGTFSGVLRGNQTNNHHHGGFPTG